MSRPSIEELADRERFEAVLEVDHAAIPVAVQRHLFRGTALTWAYAALNVVVALSIIGHWRGSGIAYGAATSAISLGMLSCWLALLPVHEHIHAWSYRRLGLRDVRIRYHWRTLTAYCIADRAVLSGHESLFVALAPFVVINTGLALALAWAIAPAGAWTLFWAAALLMHIGATSGDIAFANLVWEHRGLRLWTFDDESARRSIFVIEREANRASTR